MKYQVGEMVRFTNGEGKFAGPVVIKSITTFEDGSDPIYNTTFPGTHYLYPCYEEMITPLTELEKLLYGDGK